MPLRASGWRAVLSETLTARSTIGWQSALTVGSVWLRVRIMEAIFRMKNEDAATELCGHGEAWAECSEAINESPICTCHMDPCQSEILV